MAPTSTFEDASAVIDSNTFPRAVVFLSPIDLYQICVKKVNLVKHNRPYEIIHTY